VVFSVVRSAMSRSYDREMFGPYSVVGVVTASA
jgi:hypothetical protein